MKATVNDEKRIKYDRKVDPECNKISIFFPTSPRVVGRGVVSLREY